MESKKSPTKISITIASHGLFSSKTPLEDDKEQGITIIKHPNPKAVEARILIENINKLQAEFKTRVQRNIDTRDLQKTIKLIRYYFDHPHLVLQAVSYGGVAGIREKYSSLLLQINMHNRKIIMDEKQAGTIERAGSVIAQAYKVKRAYRSIYSGTKYKKAKLEEPNTGPLPNPISITSKKNIGYIINELKELKGGDKVYNLRDNEIDLFESLLNLPYRIQHATNHFYPTLNAGTLNSYTEIQRRDSKYTSPFSTKGNIDKLGNGGFIFFRVYIDSNNAADTRFGDTSLIFNLNLLRKCGWVSMHDQLNPFPNKSRNTQHLYWEKRLLRTSEITNIHNHTKDKGLHDGLAYKYRTTPITGYTTGKKDTLKSFGNPIKTLESKRSFLEEIFYGEDILIGIALSVIRELRHLEPCGFYSHFLAEFSSKSPADKVKLLADLLKGLFRIEGKYPSHLRIQATSSSNTLFFQPIAQTDNFGENDRKFTVLNPDGDGRYNIDMSENQEAFEIARLKESLEEIKKGLSIARQQRARYNQETEVEKYTEYTNKINALEARKTSINEQLNNSQFLREKLITYFSQTCGSKATDFNKMSTAKMQLIRGGYGHLLEAELISLEELLPLPAKQLQLIEPFVDLLEDKLIPFNELTKCSLEDLEILSHYNIEKPISERNMSIQDLLNLYRQDPMHLECLTCDDLYGLLYEQVPHVDSLLIEYAQEEGVDFDEIIDSLDEGEAMILRSLLGYEEETPEEQDLTEDEQMDWEETGTPETSNQSSFGR